MALHLDSSKENTPCHWSMLATYKFFYLDVSFLLLFFLPLNSRFLFNFQNSFTFWMLELVLLWHQKCWHNLVSFSYQKILPWGFVLPSSLTWLIFTRSGNYIHSFMVQARYSQLSFSIKNNFENWCLNWRVFIDQPVSNVQCNVILSETGVFWQLKIKVLFQIFWRHLYLWRNEEIFHFPFMFTRSWFQAYLGYSGSNCLQFAAKYF